MTRRAVLFVIGIAAVVGILGIAIAARRPVQALASTGEPRLSASVPGVQPESHVISMSGLALSYRFADVSPGWSQTETYVVENSSPTPLQLTVMGVNFAEREGVLTAAEAVIDPRNSGDLGTHVHVVATTDDVKVYHGSLEGPAAWGSTDLGAVSPGHRATVGLRFWIDPWTGAEIQGDQVAFDLKFALDKTHVASADNALNIE